MGTGILKVFVAPMRFVRRLLINVLQLADGSYALALPVAGLDEEAAHQILSTLRAAEHDSVSSSYFSNSLPDCGSLTLHCISPALHTFMVICKALQINT